MADSKCPYCGSTDWRFVKVDRECLPHSEKVIDYRTWWCTCYNCQKGFYYRQKFFFIDSDIFEADDNAQQAHWLEK